MARWPQCFIRVEQLLEQLLARAQTDISNRNLVIGLMARTLRRFDLTSRSFFAIGEAGTNWGGNLLERSEVSADVLLATVQAHAFAVSEDAGDAQVEAFEVPVTLSVATETTPSSTVA